jgi:CRISPR-associated protein Cmr6
MSLSDHVPMAFRAQIEERSSLHYPQDKANSHAYIWAREWLKGAAKNPPEFGSNVHVKDYQITWRFVTNSGQDDGIIRPVIGGKGTPFYPGSSMKGAFRRAFLKRFPGETYRLLRYCGGVDGDDMKPGILRFHGAFPIDNSWQNESIVDLVHPQQDWQVKNSNGHSAFFMISLLRPTLKFGISSTEALPETEWDEIWQVWETALGYGIGSRVSAGYGHIDRHDATKVLSVPLKGEGLIAKRIDGSWELRPNMFKAALRGHTMRLFGGVTDARTAEELTNKLWGGFPTKADSRKEPWVGELGIAFSYDRDALHVYRGQVQPFKLERGRLDILALNASSEQRRKELKRLIIKLIKFSMLLGGFGKSWRRASHQLFFSDGDYQPDIGVHWEFLDAAQALYIPINSPQSLRNYFAALQTDIKKWIQETERKPLQANGEMSWREAWHPDRVQVWARFDDDSEAISDALDWLHREGAAPNDLKRTSLSGRMGQIGRIWHRMYPRFIKQDDRRIRRGFVELLTIFLNPQARGRELQKQQDFLQFLAQRSDFEKVFGQ